MVASKTSSKKLFIFSLSFLSFTTLGSCSNCSLQEGDNGGVKGMFVFGSSLVDNGNNNFFENNAKADYLPYGIDFPNGPSGRFTNGKNLVDLLGEHLKIPSFIPPFKDPSTKGNKIVYGVNHASGSSGILDDTGLVAGNVTSLSEQIRDFEHVTLPDLESELGCSRTDLLPRYLFVVGVGGNDIVFNYFLRGAFPRVDLRTFIADLITTLSKHLQKLYSFGARKFVLTTIYPLGNSPMVKMNMANCGVCGRTLNQVTELYNSNLKVLVDRIEQQFPGSDFSIIHTYNIVMDILSNAASKGFTDTQGSCCKVLPRNQGGNGLLCERRGQPCGDRSAYVYYDALHPTEAVNVQIANEAFSSHDTSKIYPINVQQLSQL